MSTEEQIQEIMKDLGRALSQAIASSGDVSAAIRRIHREGFSLSLVLNCEQEGKNGVRLELTPRQSTGPLVEERTLSTPSFRLDGNDVSFLKSLGIDPARNTRRRRSS